MQTNIRSIYWELSKPRILIMQLVTAGAGFFLAGGRSLNHLALLMLGTAAVAAGAGALNNYLERESDAKMERTRFRALPSGAVPPAKVLMFGVLMVLSGVVTLIAVNLLTAFLALLTAFLYVLVYTPMKRLTWLNTPVGAIPGALPPLGGWAAATGSVGAGGWVLFALLFAWQHPHFYAIAWMFKEDYRKAGFKMLPVVEPDGRRTFQQVIAYSLILVALSALPAVLGISGLLYLVISLIMGLMLFRVALRFVREKSHESARGLLKATVYYLPLLLIVIFADAKF